ncbi:hypothetical protein [Actinomyces oris]|uniref:hypothetical protein n=1 Tax=Actinomyces oris TaxID=544580 RepID=UPI0022FD6658|nr:hypothetical protein [Actinomyces oris]WCA42319.1 hypothetical protein PGE45_09330 [Actinomyces oris]
MNNYDPGIIPNWTFFPWMPTLKNAVGGWQATALMYLVAALIISAAVFAAGHWWDHGRSTMAGKIGIVTCLIAAAVVGASSHAIGWAANLGIFG